MYWFILFYTIISSVYIIFLLFFCIDFFIAATFKLPPEVPSARLSRQAVINEIKKYYSDKKSLVDIGSGWGGLVFGLAREFPKMFITGVEMMPQPFIVSVISKFFKRIRNAKIVFGDAVKYVRKNKHFDICVAYQLTSVMGRIEKLKDKFDVMLVLDFPLPNTVPTRSIKLHKDMLGQHYLYIYENI